MSKKNRIMPIFARATLVILGTVMGVLMALSLVRWIMPERATNIDFGIVEFTVGHGDLLALQGDIIAPPDDVDMVLSEHRLAWDADGFRDFGDAQQDQYDIVALGDSYTEAANVAIPWANVLSDYGYTIKNLGYRGYGPQEEALVWQEYGITYDPGVVIIGFFGGNDLSNASSYDSQSGFELPSIARLGVQRWQASNATYDPDADYQYPVDLVLDDERISVAFFNSYISWLNVSPDDVRESRNLLETVASWQRISDSVDEDTCLILAYFPSKPQIYLPYVADEDREQLLGEMRRIIPEALTDLRRGGDPIEDYDIYLENLHHMRDVVVETALSEGWHVVDTTPAFEEAAASGEMLYYAYDTHWNQEGHRLTAQVVADYLDTSACIDS